jgi:hypothetical protein
VCIKHCTTRGSFGACFAFGPDECEAGN